MKNGRWNKKKIDEKIIEFKERGQNNNRDNLKDFCEVLTTNKWFDHDKHESDMNPTSWIGGGRLYEHKNGKLKKCCVSLQGKQTLANYFFFVPKGLFRKDVLQHLYGEVRPPPPRRLTSFVFVCLFFSYTNYNIFDLPPLNDVLCKQPLNLLSLINNTTPTHLYIDQSSPGIWSPLRSYFLICHCSKYSNIGMNQLYSSTPDCHRNLPLLCHTH
jgi:hypothetical protein